MNNPTHFCKKILLRFHNFFIKISSKIHRDFIAIWYDGDRGQRLLEMALCWILPLSTKVKTGNFFFPLLTTSNIIRIAALHQLRLIDSKRLTSIIDSISLTEHNFIKQSVTDFIR